MSHSISISDKLYKEMKEYCDLNNMKVSSFCEESLKKSLNESKYGDIPFGVIENKMPTTPNTNEIIPVIPMTEPDGTSHLIVADKIEVEEKPNENEQKIKKQRKTRVLN